MKLLLLGVLSLGLRAQTLPANFFGAGGGYGDHATGSACLAVLISTPASLYSYSCYNSTFYRGKPTLATETGLATLLRCMGQVCLMGLGTAGVAQGAATTGAFSAGGALVWQAKGGFTVALPMTWEKAGSSGAAYRLLLGWSFK